jgi:hypothetical protein
MGGILPVEVKAVKVKGKAFGGIRLKEGDSWVNAHRVGLINGVLRSKQVKKPTAREAAFPVFEGCFFFGATCQYFIENGLGRGAFLRLLEKILEKIPNIGHSSKGSEKLRN